MPCGGTSPTRAPGGTCGSAAKAAVAKSRPAASAKKNLKGCMSGTIARSMLWLDVSQFRIVRCHVEPRHDAGKLRRGRRIELHHLRVVAGHDMLRARRRGTQRV